MEPVVSFIKRDIMAPPATIGMSHFAPRLRVAPKQVAIKAHGHEICVNAIAQGTIEETVEMQEHGMMVESHSVAITRVDNANFYLT
jgi:hypothetical protein